VEDMTSIRKDKPTAPPHEGGAGATVAEMISVERGGGVRSRYGSTSSKRNLTEIEWGVIFQQGRMQIQGARGIDLGRWKTELPKPSSLVIDLQLYHLHMVSKTNGKD